MVPLLCAGRCETTKAAYHAAGLVLASGAAVYNAAAFCARPTRYLAWNALGYSLVAWYEFRATQRHWQVLKP